MDHQQVSAYMELYQKDELPKEVQVSIGSKGSVFFTDSVGACIGCDKPSVRKEG